MKTVKIIISFYFILSPFSFSQQNFLIADYPLKSNSFDSTGRLNPMTLTNTSFQDNGIYCNGKYIYSDTTGTGCNAETPILPSSIFNSFSLSVDFKPYAYPDSLKNRIPVIIGGDSYRWIGITLLPDSTVGLLYNNENIKKSSFHYLLNKWYTALISYDSLNKSCKLFINGELVDTLNFIIVHGSDPNDFTFSITNFGIGFVFNGILKELKIYSNVITPTSIKEVTQPIPSNFILNQNFPNPFNPVTLIHYSIPKESHITIKVYDLLGKEIATLVNERKSPGEYSLDFYAINLPSGVYFYRMQAGSFVSTKKFVLLK